MTMMEDDGLAVGVDIGGTKTRLLVGRGTAIVAEEEVHSIEWRSWNRETDMVALAALIRKVAGSDPAAVAIGAHGCDAGWHCLQWEGDLQQHLAGTIKVVNDAELLVPAAGFSKGVGVVSGTGSVAVARTDQGEMLVAGGWGWILGDEGSAAALVREAARAVRGSIDLGESGDPLVGSLMSRLETSDPTKIGRLLNETRSAAIWGSYAGAVFDAAARHSPLAVKVINEGATALARQVGILAGRGADARHVVIGGGVAVDQPSLFEAFRAAMGQISPASEVTLLKAAPVTGALALARTLLVANI
ncbi:ATPase [Rhizobium laguerreae]|uniref:BadF/BadG/BcrA/BcrD ATPase family protein n=1 Tax=Rhizobium laguerreae TaxID=1076926 RepID=UPI001C8FC312|nr:BadF/BadG/BcrA/BcrD ATPase family protein [Rhizobium laguerreae]MBY3307957.1 ATPase [Rhizobium laguerreae]